ncbi:uncharacterized protein LOC132059743 isoform X1 [Lycium ferocissimum]|uniref:uncharacterized protein LOC132059743 isoform X1 n=1 Tax=Lycium ferocissimum TaxID=112874 RepID=UPI002815507A|nr:uncharacterized protein LOC132059743 isoform X1 [Lycium ferocissimum]XP_059308471.1 uncharacterized protein LOC132059743 isoform X1 [Lycium ferocissimum]XP_059308472.1 uncharacterized protein LOC132059743 isoform X1 [Lycium ferocissimum]XP_059308473.1 uncharacterized protein LOC132059743 isoform X1 [Lycium ferocissimum]XP_059308474.1 uncharacterized protein LOC132059743 isoform X1 [Lycium ferocissimum]XP_059308476.1 uncharacterized protein LOC132059743 isoform X1 [Lycium ferocissimum]
MEEKGKQESTADVNKNCMDIEFIPKQEELNHPCQAAACKSSENDGKLIGNRKTLNYIEGKDRKRSEWPMREYRLDNSRDGTTSDDMQIYTALNNDEISVNPPTLNHHRDACDLPSSDQVPLVEGSPYGSRENEAPRYGGWPFRTPETRLPPFDGPFESLTEEELAFFDNPDPDYPRKRPRND